MYWRISKEFSFCYGHRVWSQTLNSDFSLDDCLKCRYLHGHQGKILVYLEADRLKNGMVTDFNHLNWFKQFLDMKMDHKFILDINDPLFKTLLPKVEKNDLIKATEGYYFVDVKKFKGEEECIKELYESYVLVDFIPTSENLCLWFLKIIQNKMKVLNIKVSHVEFLETPKSKSIFYA